MYYDTACVRASESMRVSEGASLRVRACERKGKGKREGKWEGKDDQLVRESEKARNRDSDGNDGWGIEGASTRPARQHGVRKHLEE